MIGEAVDKITLHPALVCEEQESVEEISRKLCDNKDRRIFVNDKDGILKGIITTTDIVYKASCDFENAKSLKAKDIMVAGVKSIDISEDLDKALEIMNELKTFNCPITEGGKIIGVVSYHDLMNHVVKSLE
jgi:CBS domain-containing protein